MFWNVCFPTGPPWWTYLLNHFLWADGHGSNRKRETITTSHASFWTRMEILYILSLWGEVVVQAQLGGNWRNRDVYVDVTDGIEAMGYNRGKNQYWVMVKDRFSVYQRLKLVNKRRGTIPDTFQIYYGFHVIHGRNSTIIPHAMVESTVRKRRMKWTGIRMQIL